MDIENNRLSGVQFTELTHSAMATPPRYIVLHNTAGGSVSGTLSHLKSENLSYHVLVDRAGKAIQCVPFNRAAGHAGKSNWRGREGLNGFSIGVSAANWGQLSPQPGGQFFNRGKNGKVITSVLEANRVVVARHQNGGGELGWEKYPEAQVSTMLEVCKALVVAFPSIVDIVGHDDIAVGRKVDPGPAFPVHRFHALVPQRVNDEGPRFRVNTPGDTLTLRRAPVAEAAEIRQLPHGQVVALRSRAYKFVSPKKAELSGWASVDVDDDLKHDGFVNASFLVPVS
jgi:N-acetylmuramoyl-L-alanine amidase